MKTIADFKRRLTVGTKLKTIRYIKKDEGWVEWMDDWIGLEVREVSLIKSNCFAIKTFSKRRERWEDSFLDYPTKKEFSVINDNTIAITKDFVKLVYEFV